MEPVSRRISELGGLFQPVQAFFDRSQRARERSGEEACDFRAGDPQELAMPAYVEALRAGAEAQTPDWFAYTQSLLPTTRTVAAALRERTGLAFGHRNVTMTNGAIAGIAVSVAAIADPDDEVIIVSPPHFLYEPLIRAQGGRAVRVAMDTTTFDLDVDAVQRAFTPRTRAVIVNTPHNPTGKIYPPKTLERLGAVLNEASERTGRAIYVLADEAYCRILFDGHSFHSPAAAYPRTLVIYTYGKTLLAPGQRLGYVAVHPEMPEGPSVLQAVQNAQLLLGWAFPNALLQHALPELEPMSIDVTALQRKRDRMVEALRGFGYELHMPEATFYLLVRSPLQDDEAFTGRLAHDGVLVMPGRLLEAPGFFRISLTASDPMIERSLPVFERAIKEVN